MLKIPSYWKSDWFIGLAVTLIFLLLGVVGNELRVFDWQAYDMGVRFTSSRPANPNVVVVAIDDAAIQELGSWPWPRDMLAKVTDTISSASPAVIGYAVPFDTRQSTYGLHQIEQLKDAIEQSKSPNRQWLRMIRQAEDSLDTDRIFANSLQRAGPVVLAVPYDLAMTDFPRDMQIADHLARFTVSVDNLPKKRNWFTNIFLSNPVPIADSIYPPIQELSRYVTAIGLLNTGLNRQEQARREPLLIQYGKDFIPSFSLMIVARYLRLTAENIKARLGDAITIANTAIDTDKKFRVYPYFYRGKGGQPAFKVYSILDVLNNKVPAKAFNEKAVIIGFTARQQTAQLASPIGVDMPPAIFTAHVVSSMLNSDLYHVPAWGVWVQTAVLLFVGIYLMFVLPRLRFSTGLAFSIVLVLGILNAHFILMIGQSTWIPLMVPLLALVVGHLLLSFKHILSGSVGRIQTELSNANLLLGQSFHTQGQLDQAFERYRKCATSETVLEYMYNLGLDYERKRQYNKGVAVFEYIESLDPDFRDIGDRIKRTKQASHAFAMTPNTAANLSSTLILENSGVQKPTLGRYTIERELGRGAMGMVYLGRDPKIGRTVAIKTMVLSQEFEGEKLDEVKERFFREAETAGRLNHPNIVTIYDVGEDEDLSYIAMDYLKGQNLLSYCKPDTLLPADEVLQVLAKVADALDYAHRHGVVHRDVKPANIIYDRETGVMKVTDFGVAFLTDSSKTKTGTILGSPSYMSPEQLAGMKVDGRSDLFSLGVTIYQMLTGELPFIGESLASLMYKIANEKHPDVRLFRPDLPSCVSRIINKALAKEAENRFQSGERFSNALERCLERLQ
ncbi:MAG: CHASE2 domain-containing protein [Gammaproteobacteria bacterium]|nr:CHASE2 domain-containing protein [Gammaproteobacteria bacterium]